MRKHILLVFFTLLFIFALTPSAFAADDTALNIQNSTEIIYLNDGIYITTTLIVHDTSSLSLTSTNSRSFIKSGNRVVECRDKNGNLEWEYTLYAEFSVTEGVSAICTSATYTHTIYSNDWSFSNGNATRSGNTAYGTGTFKRKVLFITAETRNIDISITCDINGNLS